MSTAQFHPAARVEYTTTWLGRMQEESDVHEVTSPKRLIMNDAHYMDHIGLSTPKRRSHNDAETASQSSKRQKMDVGNSAEFYVGSKSPKKIDPSELAASFALASLASLSPQRSEMREGVDESSVEESRSPRAEPNPVSPEKRSPIRSILKKVHFSSHVKDYHEAASPRQQFGRSIPHPRPPVFHRRPGAFEPFSAVRYPVMHHHGGRSPNQPPPPFWVHHPLANGARRMPPPHMLMQPPLIRPVATKQWICDFCNVAAFTSFQEACIHEECCKARFVASNSFPPMRRAQLPPRPRRSEEEDRDLCYEGSETTTVAGDRSTNRRDDEVTPRGSVVVDADHQEWFSGSVALAAFPTDLEWLSEVNCYVRQHCVEAFSATHDDIAKTSKRGRISLHQVGIRCRFCKDRTIKDKEIAAVSYPTSTAGIYESVKRWQRVHLEACKDVPLPVKKRLLELQSANVWVPTTRQYWSDSAKALGMVDTSDGIRFGRDPQSQADSTFLGEQMLGISQPSSPPPLASGAFNEDVEMKQGESLAASSDDPSAEKALEKGEYVVTPEDEPLVPAYVYFLMRQVETCHFTEADRFVARSKGPVGFAGFQCRYCNGHAGLGKYFPISAKSLSTNSTSQNIHAHLLKCRKCPAAVKDELLGLKTAKSKSPRLEPGWRKVFFDMIWDRLHGKN